MFWHLILGLLRDGRSRHGYELMTEYAARSGTKVSTGSFYRELARLVADGFVETGVNPPDADTRRIPYRIEESGRQAFDRWLTAPSMDDGDLGIWLMFADLASADARIRVLDRREEELWMRSKALARLRDDALTRPRKVDARYDPLPSLLSRQMKLVAAELEFFREFRLDFETWLRTSERASSRESRVEGDRSGARRKKGSRR
jgi:DNA-binding PadR family transcriptional regulator